MRWLLVLAGAAAVAGAGGGSDVPKDVEFYPPAAYQRWWHRMEGCTARHGDMRGWHFRFNPNRYLRGTETPGIVVYAETQSAERTIVLSSTSVLDSMDVQHEMIHALGIRTHYYDIFVKRCRVETDSSFRLQSNPVGGP